MDPSDMQQRSHEQNLLIVYTEYKMTILLMNCETMENMDPGGQTTSSSCLTGMPGTGVPDPKRI